MCFGMVLYASFFKNKFQRVCISKRTRLRKFVFLRKLFWESLCFSVENYVLEESLCYLKQGPSSGAAKEKSLDLVLVRGW